MVSRSYDVIVIRVRECACARVDDSAVAPPPLGMRSSRTSGSYFDIK